MLRDFRYGCRDTARTIWVYMGVGYTASAIGDMGVGTQLARRGRFRRAVMDCDGSKNCWAIKSLSHIKEEGLSEATALVTCKRSYAGPEG